MKLVHVSTRIQRLAIGLVVLAGVAWLDWLTAERLTGGRLHLPVPVDGVTSICPGDASPARELIARILEEHAGAATDAPCRAELHTPTDWMLKASPYPPYLGEYDAAYPPPLAGSAVVTTSGRTVQITAISGAADTTPSRFVPSVRGEESYRNDHYPTYLFLHEAADSERPKLLFAAWSSEEVAGIEGIRELAIAVSLLVVELASIALMVAAYRWKRMRF